MKSENIRKAIAKHVSQAIDTTPKDDLDRHNTIEILVDRVINEFIYHLPEPVDVEAKYELTNGKMTLVTMPSLDGSGDEEQILYLQRFADDMGYNRYRREVVKSIKSLYSL